MNKHVSFEIAKLLKEKGFDIPTTQFYTSGKKAYLTEAEDYMTERYAISNWNDGMGSYPTKAEEVACSAPTIAEVVMWLYEKHCIWIEVRKHTRNGLGCFSPYIDSNPVKKDVFFNDFDLPTEAYEAAIKYTLNNLI